MVWIGGLAGCSDSTGSSKENTANIIGFWFACEFGSSSDCMILDDDGYQFTTDGEIYDIEEVNQGSEPECGQSPCFRSDQRSITVYRQLIGTYTYDDNSVEIVLDSDVMPACTENIIWDTSADFFETQSKKHSKLLYDQLETYSDKIFLPISKFARSRSNLVFNFVDSSLEDEFLSDAKKHNIIGIAGHRSVGGIRISLYNAVDSDMVNYISDFIARFFNKK